VIKTPRKSISTEQTTPDELFGSDHLNLNEMESVEIHSEDYEANEGFEDHEVNNEYAQEDNTDSFEFNPFATRDKIAQDRRISILHKVEEKDDDAADDVNQEEESDRNDIDENDTGYYFPEEDYEVEDPGYTVEDSKVEEENKDSEDDEAFVGIANEYSDNESAEEAEDEVIRDPVRCG
jgi:hypothetical protein